MRTTLITSAVGSDGLCTARARVARADTVTDWNGYASNAIVVTGGQPPPSAVLSFAMVQGAVYDAVNAIDRGHRAYLPQPWAPRSASKDAAAATAAYQVLAGLFPAQQPALQSLYETSLAGVSDIPPGAKADGIAAGAAAAGTMLAARKDDGRFGPFTPVYGTTPGDLPADAAGVRARPGPVGRERPAVRGPERRDAAHAASPPADEPRLRPRVERDQGRRRAAQHEPDAGSDLGGDLLAGPRLRALEPDVPHPGHEPAAGHRRQRAAVRDREPGRR